MWWLAGISLRVAPDQHTHKVIVGIKGLTLSRLTSEDASTLPVSISSYASGSGSVTLSAVRVLYGRTGISH
jgi:hypothetical protein